MSERAAAWAVLWARLVYGAVLGLLPREFRAEYGRDSAELFADRATERARDRGAVSVFPLLLRGVLDVLAQAVTMRLESRQPAIESGLGRGGRSGMHYLDELLTDVRHTLRQLKRAPGFAVVMLGTIAAGVGLNTAMFSVVNGVLLRPLPFPSPDALVMVWERNDSRGWPRFTVSPTNLMDWRERASAFESMAAYTRGTATLVDGGEPARLNAVYAGLELFDVLRVSPEPGRGFTASEVEVGGDDAVVLSHRLWSGRFGADPGIVGRTLRVDGQSVRVVGVLPADMALAADADLWMPLTFPFDVSEARGAHYLSVVARLGRGESVEAAQSMMESIAGALEAEYPETNAGWSAVVVPLRDQFVGGVRGSLLLLLGSVGFLLLIASVNVVNLLLVRGSRRGEEFGVRGAMGAGPVRIARQVIVESVLLSALGGALGLLIAEGLVRVLVAKAPGALPRLENVGVDGGALLFCLTVSLGVGLAVAVVPALRAARGGMTERFRGGRTGTAAASGRRLRRGLLVAETALAVVLMVGFGLLGRGLLELLAVEPGFRAAGLVTARLSPPSARYPEVADRARFHDEVAARVRSAPGITAVGVTTRLPLSGSLRFGFHRVGGEEVAPGEWPSGELRAVDGDYFETMGIPLLRGRSFTETDAPGSPSVVIVNETLARDHLDGRDPIGERIDVSSGDAACPCEIVGVVADIRENALTAPAEPAYYLPQSQSVWTARNLVVRSDAPLSTVVAALRAAVASVDPEVPVYDVQPVEGLIDAQLASPRFRLTVFGVFAWLALGLAGLGIYGVTSYVAAQRAREIGVRSALGARAGELMWMVEREALITTLTGTVIGLIVAALLTRVLGNTLDVVQPLDATLVIGTALFLGVIGATAALPPALRASRIDPISVLRQD